MKSRFLMCFAAITLFAALVIPVQLAAQNNQDHHRHHVRYALKLLGTLGGSWSIAQGINNKGLAVGAANLPGDTAFDAFIWRHRVMTDLGSLQGSGFSITYTNPNERGEVSGASNTTTADPNGEDFCLDGSYLICLGFLWRDGVMEALPTLGGNNSYAYQLNDHDQVVGVAENTAQDPTCTAYNLEAKPVVWQAGTVQELPTIFGDPDGWGYGINDRGQIVGASGTCFANQPAASLHALLWRGGPNGGVIDLGNLGGANSNIAFYISNRGQVVGMSGVPDGINFHAFLWTEDDGMRDLGTLPGDSSSLANNINSKNQAVGISFPATGDGRAFIWQNGVITDLNTLIPPGSPLYLLEAFGINDRGQIAGWGRDANGDHRAYLLIPCDGGRASDQGCEDTAAGAPAPAAVSPAPATQQPTALTPSRRFPVRVPNRLRLPWVQRNPGSGTGPTLEHKQETPADTATNDWSAEDVLDSPDSGGNRGLCQADSSGKVVGLGCPTVPCRGQAILCQKCSLCGLGHLKLNCLDLKYHRRCWKCF